MKEWTAQIISSSNRPIRYDAELCIGCNRCVEACHMDVLMPAEEVREHPVVMYPGECYYCGACVMECPRNAIRLVHPLMNQTKFVERIQ